MELLDSDLHRIIQSPQPLEDAHFKHFMFQLLRGLRFAHSYGIVHRDLKPANLLVTKACDLVISDFGLARQMPEGDGPMTEVRSRKPRRQWP
jgi:serine/threonine protein kinase